ncbi:MAG: GDSL-type esterase/lipase family protein [Chitinophagaceae bacterium]
MGKIKRYGTVAPVVLFLLLLQLFSCASRAQQLSFVSKSVSRVKTGAVYRYTVAAFDSAGHTIRYTGAKLPSWLKLDINSHELTGRAAKPGQYPVQVDATTRDTVISQHFMLTVYDSETVNILPIGNSITNGTGAYNSYRRHLWQLLHAGNYNFDLIGSWSQHHMGGPVPDPDFDMDHEGHSGWKASDVLQPPDWDRHRGNLSDWLQQYRPDIVLLELGTNEVFQCMPAPEAINNLDTIIQMLRVNNPSVKILLAQIPPLGREWAPKKLCGNDIAYEQAVTDFNRAIAVFAKRTGTAASPVILVDQFTGVDPAADMYDDIHPNEAGEKKMAKRWFAALQPFLKKL